MIAVAAISDVCQLMGTEVSHWAWGARMAQFYMRILALAAMVSTSCVVVPQNAEAGDWIYKKEDKAFGGLEATAMGVGDASVVIAKCDDGEMSIGLATPEDWKDDNSQMNLLSPKIIMAIDGSEPFSYETTLGENRLHKLLATTDDQDDAKQAIEKMVAAKKKIEIGIELGGKKYHASKISAAGASKKLQSVLDTCATKEKSETKPDEKK